MNGFLWPATAQIVVRIDAFCCPFLFYCGLLRHSGCWPPVITDIGERTSPVPGFGRHLVGWFYVSLIFNTIAGRDLLIQRLEHNSMEIH